MTVPTQAMENTTEVEYVSIYEQRPRKPKGRPRGTYKLSDEEKREKARLKSKRYYDANPEKERQRKRLEYARKKEEAKKI